MKAGKLVVISGFSGVGKGTVIRGLMEQYPEYTFSVSATTRSPRPGEENGREYFFISHETFDQWIEEGKFLEYARYVENSYGTPLEYVRQQQNAGKHVVLDIEIQGALQVKKICPDAEMIFLIPPSARELYNRISGRGSETKEQILGRLQRAVEEAEFVPQYEHILVNAQVADCIEEVNHVVYGMDAVPGQRLEALQLVDKIKTDLIDIIKGEF